ncbi:MAG: hypothetical protein ACE5KM_11240 [Planctomycetaceae bacterium]
MLERKLLLDSLYDWWWSIPVMLAAVLAVVLIFLLLRYERTLVSRRVGVTLLFFRIAVLLVWVLMLMQPVARWTWENDRNARILVAVDLSESMGTSDGHAGKAEKLRWARAIGMIGNDRTNARIDRWIEDYRNNREPRWVDPDETRDPETRAAFRQSRKENLEGIFTEIDRLSRKDIALRLLTKGTNPLLKRLAEVGRVDVVVFAGKTESVEWKTLDNVVDKPPVTLRADASDIGKALNIAGGDDSPLIGVVLLTDGRDNVGRDMIGAAARLGQMNAPVYPIILGSVLRPTDISIGDLKYPETAFKEDNPQLKARINTPGFEGKELTVVLERVGGEPVTKTVKPTGAETDLVFDLDAAKVGRKQYKLRVDVQKNEIRDDNNVKSFAMNIVDDKVRVLLVEGEARWEFRFIDNALSRDERVDVKRVVFRQPYLGILKKNFFPRRLDLPKKPDDLENSPFAEPDLVILGDVDAADLTETGWQLLERFVSEGGGTLVMLAGKEYFPLKHRSPTLDALLPVTDLRPLNVTGPQAEASPTERGFRLRLTPEGKREPMFQFEDDPGQNELTWAALPGHLWGLLGEAKRGATVFATAMQPGQRQTLEEQRRSSIIVHQNYGFGQVLWIGLDSTWRWRHRVGDKYHHRFWGQIGRWAATNKATAGNEFVKFGPERTDIEAGEDAVIRARWSKKIRRRFPKLKAKVQIFKTEDKNRGRPFSTLNLKPDGSRPLVEIARAVSLPPGNYKVRLVTPGVNLGDVGPIEADLVVRDRLSVELQDLSSNRPLLASLAGKSDGKLLLPDQAHRLPDYFRNPDSKKKAGDEFEIWDHWTLMILFFALLTFEWVVRKLSGLP